MSASSTSSSSSSSPSPAPAPPLSPTVEQKYPKPLKISKDPASRPAKAGGGGGGGAEEHMQLPDDNQFVPLKHILDRWLVCADYITQEGSDLYHANLAALACLKDVYLMSNVTWEGLRDKVYVGIIKDDKEYGTTSVSMGVAVQYFEKNPDKRKVLILNCGTGGTKYGLYVSDPFIHEIHKSDGGNKDGQISCLEIENVGYNPRTFGLAFSSSLETVEKSLGKEKRDAIEKCEKSNKWESDIEAIAFITGSIRGYYVRASETEQNILDDKIAQLFHAIGVNCVPGEVNEKNGNSTFFLSQEREGELELLAAQALHKNLGNAQKISKKFVPVVALGIGRGTAQWAMKGEILGHDAGMNNIPLLAQLGHFICKKLQGRTLKLFLKNVEEQTSQGNFAVIALKSGCTLAFTPQVHNFAELKKKFLKLEPPPPPAHSLRDTISAKSFLSAAVAMSTSSSIRLFLAQNGNPDVERVAWKTPTSLTTIDALCAYASKLLHVNQNFIAVYHENGSRIRDIDNIASEDLLFFSQGEPFGAPPGLPTLAEKKLTLKLTPLSWICDRWLLGHETSDKENEQDKKDEKITHASLSTLKEIWYYNGSLEWHEIRDKMYVCFEEDERHYIDKNVIEDELKNDVVVQKDEPGDEKLTEKERSLKRVTNQFEARKKFLKINRVGELLLSEMKISGNNNEKKLNGTADTKENTNENKANILSSSSSMSISQNSNSNSNNIVSDGKENEYLNFCGLSFPVSDFPKIFVEKMKEARDEKDDASVFEKIVALINGAKFPYFLLTKKAFPLLYELTNFKHHSRTDSKRNEYRALLRKEFSVALHEPPVAPPPVRVYFGLNSENDGNAFRVSPNWTLSRVCAEAVQVLCPGKSGMLFTRVFNRLGFEIQPVNVLMPIGMKDEDTLLFSFGEDFGEEVSGAPVKSSVPAIPVFSIRKLADIDIATGRINVVFDFTLLVPRDGVPKEVRRDGFLVKPIRVSVNSESFLLDDPTSVIVTPKSNNSFAHIVPPEAEKGIQFYKWKARPMLNISLNSCDDELHSAIRDCPFDVHILHFVVELKPMRTRGYKVAFDMHFMKRGCIVRDKEKVDYLPEFDVDWQTSRVELSTRVPLGIEKKQWTESCYPPESQKQSPNFLCVGQEEMMEGVTKRNGRTKEKDPKWLDRLIVDAKDDEIKDEEEKQKEYEKKLTEFKVGVGCKCTFRENDASSASTLFQNPSFSNFVSCPKKVIEDLAERNIECGVQQKPRVRDDSAFAIMHYSVLIRRDPTLLTLLAVFPVFLLCLLALAIVWQTSGFTDSVANIAAVLLALFAYSPVVRSRLPPSPSITTIDKLLNYAILVCFIVLITAVSQEAIRQTFDITDDNVDDLFIFGVEAKVYLAHISLVSSVIISLGHFTVFIYFLYKTILHIYADKRQTDYVSMLDDEEAAEEQEQAKTTSRPAISRLPSRMKFPAMHIGDRKQGSIQLSSASSYSRQEE